jgi:hypothetical protein
MFGKIRDGDLEAMGSAVLDYPRIAVYVGGFAVVVVILCMLVIGVANNGSRTIWLAIGAVLGSILLLVTQLVFELQSTSAVAVLRTEFTIDKAKPKIVQFHYPISGASSRVTNETGANKFLLETNPSAFNDTNKLWKDMSLFSLVVYLWNEQHDWQVARDELGTIQRFQFLSSPDKTEQCTKVNIAKIQGQLRKIGNSFADYKLQGMPFEYMCLPPNSSIDITPDRVVIDTPYCTIRFDVEGMVMSQFSSPGSPQERPTLQNGQPRFETRTGIIRITINYNRLRAQSRMMGKYQAWANDVVARARTWFSTEAPQNAYVSGGDFE